MKVKGRVKMTIWLNVYDLDTDAVEADSRGNARITEDEQFFCDWTDAWNQGIGELLGVSVERSTELEVDDEDDEDDEDEDN